ncbi:MAG: SGNH/GDSL hydrolase family protein [Clostridia bacterium]|nr:SGNH/GDSL hydrolase family protein [Clostridia bacterium]
MEAEKLLSWFYGDKDEKPLDRIVDDGGFTKIFKRIGVIGDSLSSGEFEAMEDGVKTYHDNIEEYSWGKIIMRSCGRSGYVFSRGGMTCKEYCDSFADTIGAWEQAKACDAYIIALGVNDTNQIDIKNIEIGSTDDVDLSDYKNNKKTFTGYYAEIIQRYKIIQPRAKFFLITMPIDKIYAHDYADGSPLAVSQKIREIAGLFDNTYIIDLEKYGPKHTEEYRNAFYMGGHLNPMGYVVTAKLVSSYIDYIVRHNVDDFKEVGFIGTDLHYND